MEWYIAIDAAVSLVFVFIWIYLIEMIAHKNEEVDRLTNMIEERITKKKLLEEECVVLFEKRKLLERDLRDVKLIHDCKNK